MNPDNSSSGIKFMHHRAILGAEVIYDGSGNETAPK
jgi:hypothetical protein